MTIDELLAIEEIKNLRYGYAVHFDAQDLNSLMALFTEDAICDFGAEYGQWRGRETIRQNYRANLNHLGPAFSSLHVMANPWITLTSPTEAHGRWTLMDFLTQRSAQLHSGTAGGPAQPLLWLALYEDDYRKVNGRWLIAHVKLHFLWPSSSFAELRHALVERPPQA